MPDMRYLRLALSIFGMCSVAAMVAGCAHTTQFASMPDQSKAVENPAKARIYLVRTAKVFGDGVGIQFYMTGSGSVGAFGENSSRFVGEIGPGHYLCWEVTPGIIKLNLVQGDPKSAVELKVDAGQTWYLRAYIRAGLIAPKAAIDVVPEAEGKALLKRCKPPNT